MFTANDAHMRGYNLVVPSDCTASNTPALTLGALAFWRSAEALNGDVSPSTELRFAALARQNRKPRGLTF